MLLNTYEKVTKLFREGNGYRNAAQLKEAKVTTVQIKELFFIPMYTINSAILLIMR